MHIVGPPRLDPWHQTSWPRLPTRRIHHGGHDKRRSVDKPAVAGVIQDRLWVATAVASPPSDYDWCVGDGRGIMVNRGYVPPPSFHVDYLRDTLDGYFFDVISNGVRNMPAYAHQIKPDDRWAIVAYMRALQRSRNASENDVPIEMREKIRQAGQ